MYPHSIQTSADAHLWKLPAKVSMDTLPPAQDTSKILASCERNSTPLFFPNTPLSLVDLHGLFYGTAMDSSLIYSLLTCLL